MSGGLQVTGLHKAFGAQPVLRGLDLEVPRGSLTAILGSSGSGKTTLLRLLAGFERPDGGTIRLGERTLDSSRVHLAPQRRGVGYVPQEGALFPHLDVASNIGFGLRRRRRRVRVAELLELTGLGPLAHRYPHQLSGGQQQRVALARALAMQPDLMLLDEPFSSLDAALRTSVRSEVAEVLAAAGTTAVLVTHDQDEALSMADQVAVLRHGHFVQCGPPDEVYVRPVDAEVAAFVGDANLLWGIVSPPPSDAGSPHEAANGAGPAGPRVATTSRATGSETGVGSETVHVDTVDVGTVYVDTVYVDTVYVDTVLGRLALVAPVGIGSGRVVVLVRPEQILLVDGDAGGGIPGIVRHCEYHGHDTVLAVEVPDRTGSASPASGSTGLGSTGWGSTGSADGPRSGRPIQVRVSGEPRLAPGSHVVLRVAGPVVAWAEAEAGGLSPAAVVGGGGGRGRVEP